MSPHASSVAPPSIRRFAPSPMTSGRERYTPGAAKSTVPPAWPAHCAMAAEIAAVSSVWLSPFAPKVRTSHTRAGSLGCVGAAARGPSLRNRWHFVQSGATGTRQQQQQQQATKDERGGARKDGPPPHHRGRVDAGSCQCAPMKQSSKTSRAQVPREFNFLQADLAAGRAQSGAGSLHVLPQRTPRRGGRSGPRRTLDV